jgi:hypothetical protein
MLQICFEIFKKTHDIHLQHINFPMIKNSSPIEEQIKCLFLQMVDKAIKIHELLVPTPGNNIPNLSDNNQH